MQLTPQSVLDTTLGALLDEQENTVFLGLSGGVDSVVLLHLLVVARQLKDFRLHALHVDHGLQQDSADWAVHCANLCADYDVKFSSTRLSLDDPSEATARAARYDWFRGFVRYGDILLTAHHQQDRAETVLFNLLRGSGSAGLSSLRPQRPFYGAKLVRPMLASGKAEILGYAQQHGLSWVEDPSNDDCGYSRNQIRQHILPALNSFRADAVRNIARAASNLEQENCLLREIAISDLAEVREHPRHVLDKSHAICFADMQNLSAARQTNLLRFWLGSLRLHMPSKKLMNELVAAIASPPPATAVMQEEGAQFRFYRGFLYVMPAGAELGTFQPVAWQDPELPLALFGEQVRVDATSKLRQFYRSCTQGELRLLSRENVLNPQAPQGHSLNLKKWLQDAGVPPWRRPSLPILTLRQPQRDLVLTPVDQHLRNDWVQLEQQVA